MAEGARQKSQMLIAVSHIAQHRKDFNFPSTDTNRSRALSVIIFLMENTLSFQLS